MRVIGLTGGIGSGKSTVARMFAGLGAEVIDADKIAHQLMRPGASCYKPIVTVFGQDILTGRKIDRKKVAECVFADVKRRRALERIIHPHVRKEILDRIAQYARRSKKTVVVVDVPLLFEAKLDRCVDVSIVVKAKKATQITRSTQLLGITKAEAERRIRAQMPLRKKIRLADMIIDNDKTLMQTKQQVKQIWEKL